VLERSQRLSRLLLASLSAADHQAARPVELQKVGARR
jgi:hypothetical protein